MPLILGIDPGSRATGFGVIRHRGDRSDYVASGVIRLREASLPERLLRLHDGVVEVARRHAPRELAIEEVFLARDAKAAIKLGQARGAAILACARLDMPVFEYAARAIKQAVVGTGAADKRQVQHMVRALLKLPAAPPEDAADALAAALCHAHTRQSMIRMAGGGRRA